MFIIFTSYLTRLDFFCFYLFPGILELTFKFTALYNRIYRKKTFSL